MSSEETNDGFVSIDLPSGFSPYDTKKFAVRPMKTTEVKRIKPNLMSGDPHAIFDLLRNTVRFIELEKLTQGDFWFVLAWLRVNTFDNIPLELPWDCPQCEHENVMHYHMAEENITYLPDEYCEPAVLRLPVSEEEVPLRYPRAGDSRKAQNYLKNITDKKTFKKEEMVDVELALQIKNGESLKNRIKFVNSLDPEDFLLLQSFEKEFSHGLSTQVQDTCKECGYVNKRIRFWFHLYMLVPENPSGTGVRDAISFGKAASEPEHE